MNEELYNSVAPTTVIPVNESAEVGLFWVDKKDGKVYGVGTPVRDAEIIGTKHRFAVHPSCHYEEWNGVRHSNIHWRDVRDYEMIPRGRVVFKYEPDNNHFIVYMNPGLHSKKYEDAVKAYFGLPPETEFKYNDEHYVDVE